MRHAVVQKEILHSHDDKSLIISPGFLATIYNDNLFERIWDITQRVELLNLLFFRSHVICNLNIVSPRSCILSCILSCTFSCVFSSSIIHVSALKHNWAFYGMQLIDKCQTGCCDKTEGQLSLRFATAASRSVQDISFFSRFVLLLRIYCSCVHSFCP